MDWICRILVICLDNEKIDATVASITLIWIASSHFGVERIVTANAKKTTTVDKINDRNKMPTAHSDTFACPYTRATTS